MKSALNLIMIILAVGFIPSSCSNKDENNEDALTAEVLKVKNVRTVEVSTELVTSKITSNGRIKQADNYDLSFPMNGTLASIWIAKGKRVSAGQQIATIKEITIENRISQSQLNTQQTNNNINRLQSQLKVSKENFEENIKLHREEIITGDQLNSSRLEVESLQSQLNNALIQLDIVNREVDILGEQRNLHILVAPVAGMITDKLAQAGEQVAAGQPIGILQPDSRQHVFRCTVSDREVVQLHIGSPASVVLDAYPDKVFKGQVTYISQESINTGAYEVEIALDTSKDNILPGMFGNVEISNNQAQDYLSVPVNALVWADGNEGKVMVENNLHAEIRLVKVYEIQSDQVLIHDGLLTTDKVILNANGLINAGDSITIVH